MFHCRVVELLRLAITTASRAIPFVMWSPLYLRFRDGGAGGAGGALAPPLFSQKIFIN